MNFATHPGMSRSRHSSECRHMGADRISRAPHAQDQAGWRFAMPVFLLTLLCLSALSAFTGAARAQDAGAVLASGDAAVSGFSGTVDRGGKLFIDPDGAALKIFDLSGHGAAQAQIVNAPVKLEIPARDIGQVFGIALDNASPPNIYVTATAAYGLHITLPDASGAPQPAVNGGPGAAFMDGQFGPGGNAGTVWRIDGRTGKVTLFATLRNNGADNGGAGLGNIVYDPAHFQLFVSDLDSGLVHRLDMNGNVLGAFDHGQNGRPAEGLAAVADDGAIADITDPAFDADNSDTWGLTDIRRRVWGLGFYRNRLYYAVGDGPQIWSVGFNKDGSFAGDAQIEIQQVPGGMPVTDILFTPRGRMILAQRGGLLGGADFKKFHTPAANRVLRYRQTPDGRWVQQEEEYAIGFRPDHKNASGGVALSCEGVLWSTGDSLRDDPAIVTGERIVHGLQGNDEPLVRPRNVPPWASWFIDHDGQFGDADKAGHVGDVEIARNCKGGKDVGWDETGLDIEDSWPGWIPPAPGWTPPPGWVPPWWWPRTPDLELTKNDTQCVADPANPGMFLCTFTVTVTNVGAASYSGFLNVTDNVPAAADYVPPPGGSIAWTCAQPGGTGAPVNCVSAAPVMLVPGASASLDITIRLLLPIVGQSVSNCAVVDDPATPGNNADCGNGFRPGPNLKMQKTLNFCVPAAGGSICNYWLDVTNMGTAPYTGWLHVADTLPAGSTYLAVVSASNPGWSCWSFGGSVDCYLWTPGLAPLIAEWVEIAVFVPAGLPPGLNNCAALGQPEHANDPNINGDNADCAPVVSPMQGPIVPFMGKINLCPKGWSPQVPGWKPPKGWQSKAVTAGKRTIVCGRKRPRQPTRLYCPKGWRRYPSAASVPQGWRVQTVGSGAAAIVCARPGKRPQLPPPPPPAVGPQCPPGEQPFISTRRIPRGWRHHLVRRGGKAIWCAAPRPVTPLVCPPGEQRFANPGRIPRGWKAHRVSRGGRSIWCALPVVIQPCPPGTHKVGRRCIRNRPHCPPQTRWNGETCMPIVLPCPRGMHRVGKRCVPNRPHCRPGTRWNGETCMPIVLPCPRGMHRVGKRCVPNRPHCRPGSRWNGEFCVPIVRPCPPRTHRVRGRCVPIITRCPPGMRRVRGKCRPQVILCPRGTILQHGRCMRVPRVPSEIGRPKHGKRPPQVIHCPRGTHLYKGRCVRNNGIIQVPEGLRPIKKLPTIK